MRFFLLDLLVYYSLYDPQVMLHVMSVSASYCPKKLLLQKNYLKNANSLYPLNETLVYLDLRNNEVRMRCFIITCLINKIVKRVMP